MGGGAWSRSAASHITQTNSTRSTNQVFSQNLSQSVATTMSPMGLKFRESRKSANHPDPLGIMVFLDVTGSMGDIPEQLIKETFPTMMEVIIKHGTPHPQVLFGAIGDQNDRAPLQVGQFESAAEELNKCLGSVWLEGNGQGDHHEAYLLAWLVAARHTSMDNFEERGEKGILFTVGDEASHDILTGQQLKKIMGYTESGDITDKQILAEAERSFEVFHIHINSTSQHRNHPGIFNYWKNLLGERFIVLEDKSQVAEVIGTTVAMLHGASLKNVTKDFDQHTAAGVSKALAHMDGRLSTRVNQQAGVVKI